jgi:Activator of Hsp90 ATPase homolog 1-like protein
MGGTTPDDTETVVTLSLVPFGGTTDVSLSQGPFATEERLDLHRNGWTDSFEKLRDAIALGR